LLYIFTTKEVSYKVLLLRIRGRRRKRRRRRRRRRRNRKRMRKKCGYWNEHSCSIQCS
jgi:hypothetical protein